MRSRDTKFLAILSAITVVAALAWAAVKSAGATGQTVQAPRFEVDPLWPKPLPNHWILGNTIGVSVDAQDHVWIIHRGGALEAQGVYSRTKPPRAPCCVASPPRAQFGQGGKFPNHLGGGRPGYGV